MAQNAKASLQRLQPPDLGRCRESWGVERGGWKDMERGKGTGWASLTNHLSELLDLMWCTPLHANMHVCALLLLHVRTHTNRFIK